MEHDLFRKPFRTFRDHARARRITRHPQRNSPHETKETDMRPAQLLLAIVVSLIAVTSFTPAHAQLLHSWVASNGNDGNSCDRAAPCATFNGAYTKTNAGGEITCVDGGNYGFLDIQKPLTINCQGSVGASLNAGTVAGISVLALAASDVVILRGL